MTIKDMLSSAGSKHPDAGLLLAHILKKPQTWILAHDDEPIDTVHQTLFAAVLERRMQGEPLAYITGEKEFYGRSFMVNAQTLIPRPATEHLIEQAINILKGETPKEIIEADTGIVIWTHLLSDRKPEVIVDIGTGSGCIAVTLASECPERQFIATDISKEALTIAQQNAQRHGVADRIDFRIGNALDPVSDLVQPFLIVSNPPYIPAGMELHKDVRNYEPQAALFAGPQGTDMIVSIVNAAQKNPVCTGFVIECRTEQVQKI